MNTLVRALLVLSRDGVFTIDSMKRESGVGENLIREFIDRLLNDNVIERTGSGYYRIRVSIPALIKYFLERGYLLDLEEVSRYISWDVFEGLIGFILNEWGFRVFNRLRIPVSGSRYEFDVVACKRPFVLLIEAKRHKYMAGKLNQVVNRHIMKVEGVAKEPEVLMSRVGVDWDSALLIPVIVTWHKVSNQLINDVPVVSIYQLNSFIASLDSLLDSIKVIRVSWSRIK